MLEGPVNLGASPVPTSAHADSSGLGARSARARHLPPSSSHRSIRQAICCFARSRRRLLLRVGKISLDPRGRTISQACLD